MVEPWCIGWKHRAHFWSLKSLASRTRSLLDAFLFLPAIPRLLPPAVHAPCCVPCRCDAAGLLRRASPEGTAARPAPDTHVARAWCLVAQRGSPEQVLSRGVREGVILQKSRKGQKGVKPYSGWRQINVTDANDTLQHAAFLPALVYGIGGCVHPRDSRVCQRRDGYSGDPPHRPPY